MRRPAIFVSNARPASKCPGFDISVARSASVNGVRAVRIGVGVELLRALVAQSGAIRENKKDVRSGRGPGPFQIRSFPDTSHNTYEFLGIVASSDVQNLPFPGMGHPGNCLHRRPRSLL